MLSIRKKFKFRKRKRCAKVNLTNKWQNHLSQGMGVTLSLFSFLSVSAPKVWPSFGSCCNFSLHPTPSHEPLTVSWTFNYQVTPESCWAKGQSGPMARTRWLFPQKLESKNGRGNGAHSSLGTRATESVFLCARHQKTLPSWLPKLWIYRRRPQNMSMAFVC